jgi:hypothetical protein
MLPADSNIETLVVQEEPVTGAYRSPPLPTEFWTRPIYGTNWQWGAIGANWFGLGGSGAYDALRNFDPYTTAPNTAHIVWTKPTQFGGQPGLPINPDQRALYTSTSLLVNYFKPQCILNGILYYNLFASKGTLIGWEAIDVHTGKEVWHRTAGETGNERIDWGNVVNYVNYQEIGSNAFLYTAPGSGGFGSAIGNWYSIYDAMTGKFLANVTNAISTSKILSTDSDTEGTAIGYYISNNQLCLYNYTKILTAAGGMTPETFVAASGTVNGSASRLTEWRTTLPTTFNGDNVTNSFSIAAVTPDIILLRYIPFAVQWQGANNGYSYDTAYNAKTGAWMWGPINQTGIWPAYEDVSFLCAGDGYYILKNKDRNQAYGFDLNTGKKVWGPTQLPFGSYSPVFVAGIIAYGRCYLSDLGGYVNAINLTTGKVDWTYTRGSSGYDTPFGIYPIFGYNTQVVADGKLFLTEGVMYTIPLFPAERLAINCTDGSLVWSVSQYACTCAAAIGDGYLISWNSLDNQIYSFGKGPTSTTVAASPVANSKGDQILITGTVMDKSGGTTQDVIATRFPNGLPAVSDASMSDWMEYAYQQQIRPANATGVEVSLDAVDPNNNIIHIGTATSDSSGAFSFLFTPDVPGKYTITATFVGSESYYSSFAETAGAVSEAAAVTPPPQYPVPYDYTMQIIGAAIAVIIAIAIVGLVLILRKKP